MSETTTEAALVAEQLRHTVDLLRAENEALRCTLEHDKALAEHRLSALEEKARDHEERLRTAADAATQFKVLAGLATGGGLLSVVALVKALLGA